MWLLPSRGPSLSLCGSVLGCRSQGSPLTPSLVTGEEEAGPEQWVKPEDKAQGPSLSTMSQEHEALSPEFCPGSGLAWDQCPSLLAAKGK